ncbi:MAG: C-terminal binding protein [Dongiaceae bacterium]
MTAPRFRVVVTGHHFHTLEPERAVLADLADLVEAQPRSREEVIAAARDADAILNQDGRLDGPVIDALRHCRIIVAYGVGTDRIDVDAATARGIQVCNVPDYGLDEVAAHAIALLLAFERRIPQQAAAVRAGEWAQPPEGSSRRLAGRVLGIVGLGRIGRRVAALGRAFQLQVICADPHVPSDEAMRHSVQSVGLDELLQRADYVSLHCPLTEHTRGMLNAAAFARMKPDAVLINVARGPVVDEAALIETLRAGRLRGAALDVLEHEPTPTDNPLLSMENVIITPHTAWYSEEAQQRLKVGAAEEVRRALLGEPPRCPVNRPRS